MIESETLFEGIVDMSRNILGRLSLICRNVKQNMCIRYIRFVGLFSKQKEMELTSDEIINGLDEIIGLMDNITSSDGYHYDIGESAKDLKKIVQEKCSDDNRK